jgi:hypothetical protein
MLEEKIRKNRDLFDEVDPPDGHLSRFQLKLDTLHEAGSRHINWFSGKVYKVAAVIVVLLGLSLIYYLINPSGNTNQLTASTLPQEVQEARMYYDKLAEEKLQKINECAASPSEASYIQKVVSKEIIMLDSSSVQLEQQLQNDQDNPRIINALIRNYKTKSELVDNILNKLCHI